MELLYSPKSTGGKILLIGFYIIFISLAIWIGFFFIDFANTWPEWGPEPHPSTFVWIPFAIAGFGVILLCVQVSRLVRGQDRPMYAHEDSTQTYSFDEVPSTGAQTSGYIEPTESYQTPPFCSQCGTVLDPELVEWIGPLRFRCPSCGKTGKAERSQL